MAVLFQAVLAEAARVARILDLSTIPSDAERTEAKRSKLGSYQRSEAYKTLPQVSAVTAGESMSQCEQHENKRTQSQRTPALQHMHVQTGRQSRPEPKVWRRLLLDGPTLLPEVEPSLQLRAENPAEESGFLAAGLTSLLRAHTGKQERTMLHSASSEAFLRPIA